MYLGIDVGGTKTLIACLSEDGQIVEQTKIETPKDYQEFLYQVKNTIADLKTRGFEGGAAGIPCAALDREKGIALYFGNLPWKNVSIAEDLKSIAHCEIFIENDAKLAGLSEAVLVKDQYSKVVYMTIGTGIGMAAIDHLRIDTTATDAAGAIFPVKRGERYEIWEHFASGKAIAEHYGMKAKDIVSEEVWQEIAKNLAAGLIYFVAMFQPQAVIIGGGVGEYFDRFSAFLKQNLDDYTLPLIDMPKLLAAKRPVEAVVYGCYEYIKQRLSHG